MTGNDSRSPARTSPPAVDARKVSRDWFGLRDFAPGSRLLSGGARLYLLDSVPSTNAFLLGRGPVARGRRCEWDGWGWRARELSDLVPPSEPPPGTLVVARQQTEGRGRQGRSWRDCGGLNLSVVVPAERAAFERGFSVWLGLIVALALRREFSIDVRVKWPNDIVVDGRKLGGILLENTHSRDRTLIVAGLGLNLTTRAWEFPAELQGSATSLLLATGQAPAPATVAAAVLKSVAADLERFGHRGWGPFRSALDCLDCLLGQNVSLRYGAATFSGRAVGIDDHGALLLENARGERASFGLGDVHVLEHSRDEGEAR